MNRIRTTHVGSLVRPEYLVELLRLRELEQHYDPQDLLARLDTSVKDVVRRQRECGIDIINDGEFSKPVNWTRYVYERLNGIEFEALPPSGEAPKAVAGKDYRDFRDFYLEYLKQEGAKPNAKGRWNVTGPIRYRGHAVIGKDIARLKAAVTGVDVTDVFMAAVAPASVIVDNWRDQYKSEEEYLFALAGALHEEYKAIVDAGFIVQVDDAFLATTYDVMVPPKTLDDYRRWVTMGVEALNHALKGLPQERTRVHICWGSWNGPHTNDVEIKNIVDLILRARVGGYVLEMANPRHEHEWRVWQTAKLPEGRVLIPGVISHCTNVVEHPELVAERITRLAKLLGPENIIAGTDCGFAQSPLTRRVHESIMWAKLKSLVQGAELATRQLWN